MTTNQPQWKCIANLGDVSSVDYGGYFVYIDETGAYEAEAEYLYAPDDDDAPEGWEAYRIVLDRLTPETLASEWFADDLPLIARCVDINVNNLRRDLCDADPIVRAEAYRAIGEYHGFADFDSDPWTSHDRDEVEARYAKEADV